MTFRIDRMSSSEANAIAGPHGTKLKQRLDKAFSKIEEHVTSLETQLAAIQAVTRSDKLTASSILPAAVLSATDAGSSATIVVVNHARLYGDGTSIPIVNGDSLTDLAHSTFYGIYYDDPTLETTAPTYQATTTPANALNNFIPGRHFLGNITTPASGGGATSGGASPPGTDPVDRNRFSTI